MVMDDSQGYDLLDRLAEEFADRFRRGERPSLKEYADRYPELADEIRELFPALVKVEQVEEICQDRGEAERARATVPPLSQVGDYRIIREVGRGGMGVVYEAEQVSLGRRVALKVLPWPAGRERSSLERFLREARASARLHHTNIVPVFEVGQDGDTQYYAMQFIQGQSLDAVIDELRRLRGRSLRERGRRADSGTRGAAEELGVARSLLTGRFDRAPTFATAAGSSLAGPHGSASSGPDPLEATDPSAVMPGGEQLSSVESRHRAFHRGAAHIGRQVALALAHAHARGILHRDIKPSNLLLDTEGVVWVSDFGLAKVDDDELTRTGDILGTLRYIAPERFRGQADARVDVYSLGLSLYELLVLRPAFDMPDRVALSEQIRNVDPPRLRSIDPRVPRDLETIVLKAIEKDPGDRYASAEAMAEDLRRFLDDEPIQARRAGAAEQYLRWARRNPLAATLAGLLAALGVVTMIAAVLVAGRMAVLARANERAARSEREANQATRAALRQAEADRREADRLREQAQASLYVARISLAESALREDDPETAAARLDSCIPDDGSPDRRGWEWSYLDRQCRPELRRLPMLGNPAIYAAAVSPDGRLLAAAGGDPFFEGRAGEADPATVDVYDLPGLVLRRSLAGHWDRVHTVAFRPDGKRLATAALDGGIKIWDTMSWRELRSFAGGTTLSEGVPRRAGALYWSPDGRRLAVCFEGGLRIVDPEAGRTTARIAGRVEVAAWSPDGGRIAGALAETSEVRAWSAEDGRWLGPRFSAGGAVHGLFWTSAGRQLTGFRDDGTRRVWDAATGRVLEDRAVAPSVEEVASDRDLSSFVLAGRDKSLRVVDASGAVTSTFYHGLSLVRALALSPDGRRLYVGGLGPRGLRVFEPRRDRGGRVGPAQWQVCAMAFDERGDSLRTINFEPARDGANVEVRDVAGGAPRRGPRLPVTNTIIYPRNDFAFSPDGRRLAAPRNGDDSAIGIWDVDDGRELVTLRAPARVIALAYGAGGARLAAGSADVRRRGSEVVIWDVATAREVRRIDVGPRTIRVVAFAADGRTVAAGGYGGPEDTGWAVAWDVETGSPRVILTGATLILTLALAPDGTRLAAADTERKILHLWDLATGTEVRRPASASVSCLAFTPDGNRLAMVGYDGQVHLADARTGEELLVLRSAARPALNYGLTPRLAFSRDGLRLAANGLRDVSLWEIGTSTGPEPPPEPADVAGRLRQGRALAAQGDADGAEALYSRARQADDGDPSPWIEHALILGRRGESEAARDALDRAMRSLPDEPGPWLELGRQLARFGRAKESEAARARARALAEDRLSRGDWGDADATAALAELLPEADAARGWTVLEPVAMTSAAGATLARQPDGSILVSGPRPVADTYTIEAVTDLVGITGLRLEVLPDPSLPNQGPGRRGDGNFAMDAIRLSAEPGSGGAVRCPVALTRARADYSAQTAGFRGAIGALDADPTTAWSTWPRAGTPHWAIFLPARRFGAGGGTRLQVELDFRTAHRQSTLGRFRLSVSDRPFLLLEPALVRLRADAERAGPTRLAAAHALLGDWASVVSVLGRTATRADTPALDGFLMALARHQLGRADEARGDCDRAVDRLTTGRADDETRDVAVGALLTVRGLGVDEAESLVLDAGFPADPFAR